MSHRDFLESTTGKITAAAVSTVFFVAAGILALNFSQGSVVGGKDNMISYCGEPDFFDEFEDRNGYTPNAGCTAKIDGYRINTDRDSGYDTVGGFEWGCAGSVTVYRIQDNGDLEQVADTGERSPDPEDIQVGDLTVHPISQTSGLSYYNCDWVANTYEYEFGGNLDMNVSAPDDAYNKDVIPIEVRFRNRYEEKVSGDTSVEFCTTGAFGRNRCVTRKASISLDPGQSSVKTLEVPNRNVGDVVKVSASFDGTLETPDWTGVNVDCDGDSTIERIEDCSGFRVTASKDLGEVRMVPPVDVNAIEGPRTVAPGEEVTYTANVSNLDSASLNWSNGESGETATYTWDSTGSKTVTLTVDDGFSEETKRIEVMVEKKSVLDKLEEFLGSAWSLLSFSG